MPGIQIIDGTGKSFLVKVDNENRLVVVAAEMKTQVHHESQVHGNVFTMHTGTTADTLTISTTETIVMYIENSSVVEELIIADIHVSCNAAGVELKLVKNPALASVANNNVFVPVNMNFKSGKVASGVFHTWDEVSTGITTLTGGNEFYTSILEAGDNEVHLESVIIMGTGDSLTIAVQAATGTPEIAVNVVLFYDEL